MTVSKTKTKLKEAEDWTAYFEKDKALSAQIKKALFSYADMSEAEFKNFVADMTVEQKKIFLQKMRGEMMFYKRITEEPYYKENSKGQRYNEAKRKYSSINSKGKLLASQIIK
jgi:hypothetical protein